MGKKKGKKGAAGTSSESAASTSSSSQQIPPSSSAQGSTRQTSRDTSTTSARSSQDKDEQSQQRPQPPRPQQQKEPAAQEGSWRQGKKQSGDQQSSQIPSAQQSHGESKKRQSDQQQERPRQFPDQKTGALARPQVSSGQQKPDQHLQQREHTPQPSQQVAWGRQQQEGPQHAPPGMPQQKGPQSQQQQRGPPPQQQQRGPPPQQQQRGPQPPQQQRGPQHAPPGMPQQILQPQQQQGGHWAQAPQSVPQQTGAWRIPASQGTPQLIPQPQQQQAPLQHRGPPGVYPQQQRGPPPVGFPQQQSVPPGMFQQQGPTIPAMIPPQGAPPGIISQAGAMGAMQHYQMGAMPQVQQMGAMPQPQQIEAIPQQQQIHQHTQAQRVEEPQQQTQKKGPQKGQQPPQKGPQQTSKQVAAPSSAMAKLSVSGEGDVVPMPLVKATPGIKGRKIPIETNHLQLNIGKITTAFHYDVNLEPDTPKKFLRHVVELFRQKHFSKRYPAFDGRKNLYSSSLLPFGDFIADTIVMKDEEGRDKTYKVEIKYANDVDMTPLRDLMRSEETPREALQVVDIVLRSAPAAQCITVGRSFFIKPQGILNLGEGMEMYTGFYQSAIRGWKPFLNVDVAHKAFPKSLVVIDALVELFDSGYQRFNRDDLQRPLASWQLQTFEKFIKTLKVWYEIPGQPSSRRMYRVNGIDQCARDKRFKLENGTETTIENYFKVQKRVVLRYSLMPTLWVGSQQRKDKILLPLEYCTVMEGQVLNRKMTENQTSSMIKYAATDTSTRKKKIEDGVRQANHNQHPAVKEFGFSVGNQFEKLEARVLETPGIGYSRNKSVKVSRGVWRGEQFFNGSVINKWTIAYADRRPPRPDELARFAEMIFKNAGQCGMTIKSDAEKPFVSAGATQVDIKRYFQSQKGKYDVIFVVVPNSGQQYSYVKSAAEINVGCLTQCLKMRTLGKMNPQTATNILLKVNSKLNGINHCLITRPPIMNRPCMIMGADVTHPSPDATDIPSVAAVTASHDPKAFKYNICWRLQPPRVEIIEDLENIVIEQLKYFHKVTNVKPERIVFFRDGVSEGQFDQVRNAEIRAIRSACKKLQREDYEPSITFLVVQKRHHTRLFPLNPRDSEDRNNNVPAGTCVDTMITHPFMQDFYLVSHASIQGVAKPTKYCTLWDDNKMSNDEIEQLTYFLCHMFSRCNRSVSYPAPTYYAHLAAARAKVYIENERLNMNNLAREYDRFQILDVIRKDLPMFFV